MKEPDSGSVSENDDFPILDNVSRLTRTVSSVNPVHWNEADLLETDLMGDSPFHYGIGIRPQIKRDAESYSGESRSSSSTSAGSGVIAEEDLIDWAVYQKLLGQSERQCNATSRWSTLILPNSLLISTIEKLTEMIEKGLDVSNDNGLQQMQGLLQQVICPVLRSIFNDDPGMSLDQFVREKVMTCAFRYITMFVTKMKYYSAPDEILPEFFKIMAFMFNINSRFYQRISTHTINAIIRIVPSDLDLSKVNLFITDAETHHWFQALLLWFCQSSGFEAFCKFLQTAITPDSTIPTLAMYFSWLANIIPILHPSIIKKHIEPFVISSYRRLMAVDEKDYECEKVKGDVREAPLMQVLLFCKISVYHFLNIFGRSMLIELDLLKLRFLKCVIAESPFNTRMSALEELYRFLRIGSNDLLGCTVEAQAKIEEIGLIESMYKDNLHHVAYIDRVEKVMADLFDRHLLKENVLNIIWNSQKGKHEVIQRNVQILTARLASHFDSSIAEGFFSMLQISWITGETKDRLNIIELLRRVGFDQSNSCMVSRVANFLWKQTRSEEAIENLEFQARMLDVLYDVLEEVFVDGFGKSTLIPEYILRCANDICCPKTPEAILASSVALSKRIISCYTNEMKTIKNNPIAVNQRLDLFRRIEDNIRFKFGKSYADAMACNIITAVNNLPQVVDSSNSVLSLGSKSEDWDSEYSISRALVVQFEFLKFYYSDLIASFEHLLVPVADPEWVIRLWKAVVNSTFPGVQDIGFRLFTDLVCTSTKCLFPHAERLKIFFEKNVLTLDPKMLSVAGFHCFEAFLKKTNIALANMVFRDDHEEMERNCFLTRTSIMGEEYIWQLITCGNENVHPLASNLFVCLFSSPAPEQRVPEYGEAVIHKCMDVLNKRWEKEAETLAEKAERGVKVRRILQTITELVDTNEKDHRLPKRTRPVLRRSTMGKGFFLKVQFRVDDMQLLFPKSPIPLHVASPKTFNVHDNMLLVELVEKICQSICDQGGVISPYSLSIVSKLGGGMNQRFRVSEWGQTLRELGFDSRTTIFAKPEKNRLGYDGTDDAGFLMKSGRRECELEESLLFSVLLASHSDYLIRLVELAQVREVTEQAFALLSNVPSLKQAPSIDEYGSLENTVEPFRRYLEDIARESSPAKQVYSLMVLCEYVAPWNLSSTNCYNNQTLFFFAGGIKVFRNIMVKNAFVDETSQLRGLGFYYALKVLVFSLQFALNVLSYKSEKRVYRFMTDHLPRVTECYMKEAVYRMTNAIYDKHNFSLVNKVITDCKATVRDICDLLESSLSLLKEHAANGIYQETNLEDLECPHEYDNGDLIIVAATQVIGYYCVLNWDICPNVLICTDFYEYLNSVMFGDKSYVNRMVSCWSVDIISQIIIHVGFEVNGHQVYLHVVEQLFNIIDMANTKCFWELLYKIIDHSDKRTRLPNLYSRVLHCLTWLEEAQKTSQEQQCSFPDDITLTGRLRVLSLLLEQLTIDEKADIGGPDGTFRFIELLVNHFLLPSSRAYVQQIDFPRSQTALEIHTASSSSMFDLHAFNIIPRSSSACPIPHRCVAVCGSEESQRAGFAALIAIAVGSEINIRLIRNLFMEMFYRDRSLERIIWDYQPDFSLRVAGNYVGLKNGGATCYMNSILQQIFMLPALRNAILNIEPFSNDPDHKKADEITSSYPVRALEALQSVFAHLVGYELDSYTPAEFWSTFRMSKEMVHLNEQQDALEFYNSVVEFVDEGMSMLGGEKICENTFGGLFADEKICKDCPHRYSREEPFTSISIDVQSHNNLLESLKEYVLGDVLENDNAYFCEKCQKKVRAIKRLTIQKLPPILVVQLKRFKFDWDKEVPVKFNDYVEFPFDLDMKPYTAEAAAKVDALGDTEEDIVLEEEPSDCMYSLRGVVVHSGSATGGHYYSFIKSSDDGKWYKFDDTEVNHYECDIKDVRSKWFGGNIKYADDGSDDMSSKKRGRCWWNAYLLFYEKVGTADQECSASSTSCRTPTSGRTSADCSGQASVSIANPLTVDASVSSISSRRSSTGSPITRLHKHFSTMSLSSKMRQMPPRLEVMVRQQNTKIMHERNQYNVNYFRFLKEITLRSVTYQTDTYNHILFVHISELFANFLVFTCLHASAELRNDYNDRNTILWNHVLDRLVVVKTCRLWLMSHILISEEILRVFLIEAKDPEVRQLYARIISKISLASIDHKDTIADAKTYNALPFQRALAMYGKENLSDSTCVVEMLIEVVYNMISNDKEKRGMEIYSVLLIFIIEPAPKPQLYLSLVRRGILFLLLRIYETPVMQCFAAIHNGIQNYLRLLLGLLRTIDLRTYLSVRLPGAPALTTPCPYMLAELKERIPINDIVCPSDLQDAIYAVPSYNLMTHLMNVFASGDLRVQGFMRETFLYFCWNNEIITARAYEVLMRALMQDERNPEVLTELLVTLFCDLIQMNDELSRCGVWLQYLLFSCEISVYHPRSGESGLLSIVHEPNKQKQENLIRISTVLLERFESEIPYLSRAPALLHFANEMFSIIISRYTFHEQGEVKQSANRMVPNKNDLVARLANVCKYLRTMVDAESCNEENEDNQLESSIINSPKASITTPQSGEKRPFPDDDSPTTRRDSKKFNDGSKIVSNDFPITAEVDDPELLMATSRSAIEDKKPMAPPPAYEENVFDSSK